MCQQTNDSQMMFIARCCLLIVLLLSCADPLSLEADQADLTPYQTYVLAERILHTHVSHTQFTPELAAHLLKHFIQQIDPVKSYLTEQELSPFLHPSPLLLDTICSDYSNHQFTIFEQLYALLAQSTGRRHQFDHEIMYHDSTSLQTETENVDLDQIPWPQNSHELKQHLSRLYRLQLQAAQQLNLDQAQISHLLIQQRNHLEDELLPTDLADRQKQIFVLFLKALSRSLDTYTHYFTPDEAKEFVCQMEQRFFGIGAQLKDNLNGLVVVHLIEGGAAIQDGTLQPQDRIVAVDHEPIIGLSIARSVRKIRGEQGSQVTLTVLRDSPQGEGATQQLEVKLTRGEVTFGKKPLHTQLYPFGDGVIAHLHLLSFYANIRGSSASDIVQALEEIQNTHTLYGIILDLRDNMGGVLTQAVQVTSLFMDKGVVVSLKDQYGSIQHLRNLQPAPFWDGPLLILTNRCSASGAEIVAQTLQDYGRALVLGDSSTFGKGCYQKSTLRPDRIHPEGEYHVTVGLYYTVSGQSPQLKGVVPDIKIPGPLDPLPIGERYALSPLLGGQISAHFEDDVSDLPFFQRTRVNRLYRKSRQKRETDLTDLLPILQKNMIHRLHNRGYDQSSQTGSNSSTPPPNNRLARDQMDPEFDLQLEESLHTMQEILFLLHQKSAA